MIKNSLSVAIAVMLSVTGFCQSSGKLLLSKGQKYIIENKIIALSTQQMMGQSMDSKATFFTSNNIEVKDVKDNNYNLTNTYTKITSNMNAMGQDMSFDSDKKEDMNGEMGKGMKDFIGQPKNVIVDKTGKIVAGKKDTTGKGSEGGMMSMMMKQLMGNFEETGYGLSEAFMVIPVKATTGFSWRDSINTEGVKKSTTYTIKEIKGTDAVVSVSGTMNIDTKMEMQGAEVSNKSNGKMSGEEIVDLKTGIIKQRNTTIESTGKVEAMGQEIPTTTKVTAESTMKSAG